MSRVSLYDEVKIKGLHVVVVGVGRNLFGRELGLKGPASGRLATVSKSESATTRKCGRTMWVYPTPAFRAVEGTFLPFTAALRPRDFGVDCLTVDSSTLLRKGAQKQFGSVFEALRKWRQTYLTSMSG